MTSQNCKSFSRKILNLFALLFITTIHVGFAQSVELGESLFSSNCASCHYLGPESKKLIGPGLDGHILEEHSTEWLYSWIRNSSELIASGDEDAIAVFEKYNKTAMSAFPHFSDDDLANLLAYIEEGPAEVVVDVAGAGADGGSSSSDSTTILIVVLIALLLFTVVLARIKNVLKELKGDETRTLLQSALIWLKATPIVIALFCVFVLLYGLGATWDGLLTVGVQQGYQPEQPIAFSHKIHAGENGIDCNYCHSGARHSKTSGVPSANVCMNCHTYINSGTQTGTEEISKIYDAIGFDPETRTYIEGYEQKPIEWVRIHNLPDLAYFNHSQHVDVAGVECQTCHGPVEEMDVVEQYAPLTMGWCVECHKETKVDLDNPYYHDLNENWVEKYHGEDLTVDKIGGLECGKCHY
ncbi:MAG: c-type cytochrome [Flavobacteriales bacterium]|nr:c-type cytochrome [Flavobacteriales bacterium]